MLLPSAAALEPAMFDADYYALIYPEYAQNEVLPLAHYLREGWKNGCNPSPFFNTAYYLARHQEALASGESPLEHYCRAGAAQAATPPMGELAALPGWQARHAEDTGYYLAWRAGLFDPAWYRAANPDLKEVEPLAHYRWHGCREGRNPSPHFDAACYRGEQMIGEAADVNPLLHAVFSGMPAPACLLALADGSLRQKAEAEGLFNADFYAFAYPEAPQNDLFLYYCFLGWRLGHNPSPLFNTRYYVMENQPGIHCNPLLHYLVAGAENPAFCFHPRARLDELPEWALNDMGLAVAWLCQREQLFDADWYKDQNPDVFESGMDAAAHFQQYGWREGRDPGPDVDCQWYRNEYLQGDMQSLPLWHYLAAGREEGLALNRGPREKMLEEEIDDLLNELKASQKALAECRRELAALKAAQAGKAAPAVKAAPKPAAKA